MAMDSPEPPAKSEAEHSAQPMRDEFPPLTAEEWKAQQEQWKDLPLETKVSALSGVTPSRARELLKLVGR